MNSVAPALEPYGLTRSSDCSFAIRRVDGPFAREIFFSCVPGAHLATIDEQANAVFRAITDMLRTEGANWKGVVTETAFFADIRHDIETVRHARSTVISNALHGRPEHALTELEQAPLMQSGARIALLVHAIIPGLGSLESSRVSAQAGCGCAECTCATARSVKVGPDTRFYAGNLYGQGVNAYQQTHSMFEMAERLLHEAGLRFSDVMRTWIYFPVMERDYDGFNRARREFFQSRAVDPVPASTGIGAGLATAEHDVSLCLYAVQGSATTCRVMTTPTLNEAPEYGSDFSRGMCVKESNRLSLLVSGTASLDETGATVHVNDLDAQITRMLINVAGLLEGQGAGFEDIVSAITYVKRPEDAARVQARLSAGGCSNFPNMVVHGPVCRPELLCEIEALAILPYSVQHMR